MIKGEVIPHKKTKEEIYTFPVVPVRFESPYLTFANMKRTEKKIRIMPIINTSSTVAKVEFDKLPTYLTLKTNPEILKSGQKGILEATYNAVKNPSAWGNFIYYIKIKVNEVIQENVTFSISANLVEHFSALSKEELLDTPIFMVASNKIDIGIMKPATTKEVEFKFTNVCKRDLLIRQIKPNCGCTVIQEGNIQGKAFKPGESSSIKASFSSGANKGKVTRLIYVYTNDPKGPEIMLMLNAEIE